MTTYKDTTPAPRVEKKILNKMVWRSMQLQACFNYERMQSAGWLWAMLPGLQAVHKNKDDLAASMTHNMDFLNTHPFAVTFVMGIVLSLEQVKADIPTIRAVRVAAMGPLGGIGDAIFWLTLVPITAGIAANFALDGSIIGPILFLVIFNVVQFVVRYFLMHWSYNLGSSAIGALTKHAKEFTHAATLLGIFVVGALIANMGSTTVAWTIANGESPIVIQSVIDSIFPKLIPLGLTCGLYWLIAKKNWSVVACIVLLLVVGIVGGFVGAFV